LAVQSNPTARKLSERIRAGHEERMAPLEVHPAGSTSDNGHPEAVRAEMRLDALERVGRL
jgi:hypothetical protein